MPFWSDPKSSPKLSFKWFASFGIYTYGINTYSLRSFQKPSFELAVSEYIWLNDVEYRPGLLTWNPIEIIVTDGEDLEDNNTYKLYNILKRAGYQSNNVNLPKSVIEKRSSTIALGGDVRLTQLDSDGDSIEEWKLVNPFITAINFGASSYGVDEIVSIAITLRYDYAVHEIL
tara:strand:- start:3035 stop:3553 length:519 start_codon:yes stop_codon:yes gene_type:complete